MMVGSVDRAQRKARKPLPKDLGEEINEYKQIACKEYKNGEQPFKILITLQ